MFFCFLAGFRRYGYEYWPPLRHSHFTGRRACFYAGVHTIYNVHTIDADAPPPKTAHTHTHSPDGNRAICGSVDNAACIWDVSRPELPPTRLEGHTGEVTCVAWCGTDPLQVATCSDDTTVKVQLGVDMCMCGPLTTRCMGMEMMRAEDVHHTPPSSTKPPRLGVASLCILCIRECAFALCVCVFLIRQLCACSCGKCERDRS